MREAQSLPFKRKTKNEKRQRIKNKFSITSAHRRGYVDLTAYNNNPPGEGKGVKTPEWDQTREVS